MRLLIKLGRGFLGINMVADTITLGDYLVGSDLINRSGSRQGFFKSNH